MENEKTVTQQRNKCYPNMPAFASSESYGLTKREYFAAMAMQGLLAKIGNRTGKIYTIIDAVKHADALIKALNQ